MDTQIILVCIADHQWTLEALHLASSLALDTGWSVELVKLVPVDNPYQLGVADAYRHYTLAEQEQVDAYVKTLEDYGVDFTLTLFQYISRAEAIVDAAEQVDASVVFATLPHGLFAFWRRIELWNIRRQLKHQHRTLYTLDNALEALVWPPPGPREPALAQPELPTAPRRAGP